MTNPDNPTASNQKYKEVNKKIRSVWIHYFYFSLHALYSCSSMPSCVLIPVGWENTAVWWFRATCFHGLKYLCVNCEVLKQNFIMRTEMKASSECLYPTDVFLISCGMGCKRITVSDIAYIEAMKDNCIIHMVDGKSTH